MKQGWIEERTGAKGVTFRARAWVPDGQGGQRLDSASFPAWAYGGQRKAEQAAKAHLAKMLTEVRSGAYRAPVTMTLGELVERWLLVRETEVATSTTYHYRITVRKHLAPHPIAQAPIQAIGGMDLQSHYATLRGNGVGPGSLDMLKRAVKAALNQAKRWKLLAENPADDVTRSEDRPRELRYWTPEQSAAFLASEGDNPKGGLIWRIMLLTGIRIGELEALRWSDIDFARKTMTIARTVTRNLEGSYVIGETTKTPNSRRTFTLPESCVEPLKQHKVRQREWQLSAPTWETQDGDVVFTQRRNPGRRLRYDTLRVWFAAAVARTGLPEMTPHGMRHSFATAMLINGVHPKTVASLLGDTVEMVLRVYSHVTEATRQDAIALLDAQIGRLQAGADAAANTTT